MTRFSGVVDLRVSIFIALFPFRFILFYIRWKYFYLVQVVRVVISTWNLWRPKPQINPCDLTVHARDFEFKSAQFVVTLLHCVGLNQIYVDIRARAEGGPGDPEETMVSS
jgi:hypothetical protein